MRLAPFALYRSVLLTVLILVGLLACLVGLTISDWPSLQQFAHQPNVVWGLLLVGLMLSLPYLWRRGKIALLDLASADRGTTAGTMLWDYVTTLAGSTGARLILGPAFGLLIWSLPLGLDSVAQRAVAIVGFMLAYWMTELLDYGVTALLGCLLFWLLHVAPPAVAFSGFSTPTPWFFLGGLLIGQAVSQTGLAKRLGYYATYAAQGSPTRLLLGFILLVFVLGLFMGTVAQIATLAPVAMGVFTTLGLPERSNLAKGVFLVLCYVGSLCAKMILSSGVAILAWGIIEKQTGVNILWSQWFLAFLPLILPTILASWLTMRWLYPPETPPQPFDHASSRGVANALGPWSRDERKVLGWLLLAITLWSTDFWHHINPAAVAMAIGMILTLPGLGVLDMKTIKSVNFFIIVFVGGVLSMASVLNTTHALTPLTNLLSTWHEALLANAWHGTLSLYWGGFLYHFLMASEFSMVSTVLPVLLDVATRQGYNPAAIGLLWLFAGSGKLFIYTKYFPGVRL